MERCENEVAGLGCGQRGRDRLEIAHLAQEDHVGVLAERAAQGLAEARRVGADLALVDEAALVAVEELDRILDRHDVVVARPVDLVDHRRERGRLAGAGRAGHEYETARLGGELVELRGQAEVLERLQVGGDHPEGSPEALALEVDVDAKAGETGDRVRDVDLPIDLQMLLLLRREDAIEEALRVVGRQPRELLDALQPAVQADDGVRARRDVQVGCTERDHVLEQVVDRESGSVGPRRFHELPSTGLIGSDSP